MTENLLRQRIQDDMKTAMRAKDSERLGAIRLLLAAIKQREIDERIILDEVEIFIVLNKMIKQRRDAYEQFKAAQREDLAIKEAFEIEVLQKYLPEPLTSAEIEKLITSAIQEVAPTSMRDMGKVMAIIKPKVQGRADIGQISAKVKALLTP